MTTSGIVRRVRLGDEVVAHCGRCKEERTHQVVALNGGGGVERVICRTCNSNHLYRDPQAKVKRAGATTTRAREARTQAQPTGPLHDYSTREAYAKGQLIAHAKFGVGEVVEARQGKIVVRFADEQRTLLHAG